MDFGQIAILFVTATILGVLSLLFKQPLIVGYMVAGALLSKFNLVPDSTQLESLGQIGVTLLLFLLGLEMNLKEIATVGKASLATGVGQIVIAFFVNLMLCLLLGFGVVAGAFIAIALTFSSTIIIIKLLSEKKDLRSLYGRISVGYLLVQDFVAIMILILLSSVSAGSLGFFGYMAILLKAFLLYFATWIVARRVLSLLLDRVVGKSSELTFIFSISWAFGVAAFSYYILGFSLEIGGFLAGLALSATSEHLQIAGRTKPLRDFFLTIFFLILGARIGITPGFLALLPKALLLSVSVLILNPLIVMTIMSFLGYKRRTSFMASLATAQISEFSLIIVTLGAGLGYLTSQHVSLVTLIGVITMTTSTYLILGANGIFKKLSHFLVIFEKKVTREGAVLTKTNIKNHIVLVGCDRTGETILPYLKVNYAGKFVVVDFNPLVFTSLASQKVPVIFGDIEDQDILEASNLAQSKFIISTTSDMESNLTILEYLRTNSLDLFTLFTAASREDGLRLYEKGASFVLVPEVVAGDHIKHLLRNYAGDPVRLSKLGKAQFNKLVFQKS